MSALKPLASVAPASKAAFQAGAMKSVSAPRQNRARKLSDPRALSIKALLFGGTGTGKNYAMGRLLAIGKKIVVLTTDIGESGNLTVALYIRNVVKKPELLDNLIEIPLYSYEEVQDFLANPAAFFPEIYTFDPDFIVWDGFGSFQQIETQEYIGDMQQAGSASEGEEAGLQLDQRKWGMVKTATVRFMDKFLSLQGTNGKPWHKIVTCHEDIRMKGGSGEGSVAVEKKQPLLSGAGGKIILGGFDLIIRTFAAKGKSTSGEEVDESGSAYYYTIEPGQNTVAKNRGFRFTNEKGEVASTVPGDMEKVWKEICAQAGIS